MKKLIILEKITTIAKERVLNKLNATKGLGVPVHALELNKGEVLPNV